MWVLARPGGRWPGGGGAGIGQLSLSDSLLPLDAL